MLCSSVHSVSQISVSGCRHLAVRTPKRQGLRAPVRIQAVTRREIQTEAAALVGFSSIKMASDSAPAQEFRNTPPETGVGGDAFRAPEPLLNLVPVRCAKTVHFIRHGEGFHNIGFDGNEDAHLTPFGWSQAHGLHDHIQSLPTALGIQLIVVSPMVRTLETATGAFGAGLPQGGADVMMTSLEPREQWQAGHPAVALPPGIPVISHEGCRERVSWSKCDARRSLQETKQQFPGVDFSLIQSEQDTMWPHFNSFDESGARITFGEPEEHVTDRGIQFLRWLMTRPESRIAVVSHCGWLFHTLSAFSHAEAPVRSPPINAAPPGTHARSSELDVDFQNCEMRTMVLTDPRSGPDRGDPTWFQGGPSFQSPV
ncbi:TPA: hypothetical protein ACH3X2_001936 [Trebouxia sp. C0005]|nr:MAG: hypothetical protein FRX49_09543 [Trebouxia sp. A1-2]